MTSPESFSHGPANEKARSSNFNDQDWTKLSTEKSAAGRTSSSVQSSSLSTTNPSPPLNGSSKADLIALSKIRDQTSLAILQEQLEKAHHLLAYQDTAINHLTEKVTYQESALAQCEQELAKVQKVRDTQGCELVALQSICDDLRSLLQRQQKRPHGQPLPFQNSHLPSSRVNLHTLSPRPSELDTSRDGLISFGYESAIERGELLTATKSPPVQVWSADHSSRMENHPLPLLRKLSTLLVEDPDPSMDRIQAVSSQTYHPGGWVNAPSQVELPNVSSLRS